MKFEEQSNRQIKSKNKEIKRLRTRIWNLTSRTNDDSRRIISCLQEQIHQNENELRETMIHRPTVHHQKRLSVDSSSTTQPSSSSEGSEFAGESSISLISSASQDEDHVSPIPDQNFKVSDVMMPHRQDNNIRPFTHVMSDKYSGSDSDGTVAVTGVPTAGSQINFFNYEEMDRASITTVTERVSTHSLDFHQPVQDTAPHVQLQEFTDVYNRITKRYREKTNNKH